MILKLNSLQRYMISSCTPGSIGRNISNKYVADSIETRVLILALLTTPQPCTPGIRSQKQPSNAMVIPAACTVPTGVSPDSVQNKQGGREYQEDGLGSSNGEDKMKQDNVPSSQQTISTNSWKISSP
eukprot:991884_1